MELLFLLAILLLAVSLIIIIISAVSRAPELIIAIFFIGLSWVLFMILELKSHTTEYIEPTKVYQDSLKTGKIRLTVLKKDTAFYEGRDLKTRLDSNKVLIREDKNFWGRKLNQKIIIKE